MPRLLPIALVLLAALPARADAQVGMLVGAGLSTPIGSFGDAADVGWHIDAGLQLGVASIPIALRADGAYHSFGEATSTPKTNLLSGGLSVVVKLPGVGLVPYLLGGIGQYRFSVDGSDATSDRGFHGAFGVNIGALGFGGFGEVRLASIGTAGGDSRIVTATIGLRL